MSAKTAVGKTVIPMQVFEDYLKWRNNMSNLHICKVRDFFLAHRDEEMMVEEAITQHGKDIMLKAFTEVEKIAVEHGCIVTMAKSLEVTHVVEVVHTRSQDFNGWFSGAMQSALNEH
jgi:hypothetical protein